MVSKFEAIGIGISIACMAAALFLLNQVTTPALPGATEQAASIIVIEDGVEPDVQAQANAVAAAMDENGNLRKIVVDEVVLGTGPELTTGDTAVVHYVGRLQNGQEFDNSNKRGEPFTFTIGTGQVIAGWDEGLLGMKVGGQRILVIPAEKAYGSRGAGPIPPNATLVFAVELLEIQ